MAEDPWNESRHHPRGEPQWRDERRRTRAPEEHGRQDEEHHRARWPEREEAGYRPFGDTGPIYTQGGGAYSPEGRPYGAGGRPDELPPGYRNFEADQRRIHRGDYDPDRYTPNSREGRGEEPRSWWDRTHDEVSAWFGDENARRRREWDEHHAERNGEHRGRGPKGYRRSDERIAEDVNDRLTDDPYIDASEIEVNVKAGEVTLAGFIFHREDKRRAEDLAESVAGVIHVQNNLRARPRGDAAAADISP